MTRLWMMCSVARLTSMPFWINKDIIWPIMLLRPLREEEHKLYNSVVHHPLQSWEWGEFRKKTGIQVERVGFFDNGKLHHAEQVFFHPIPLMSGMTAGYFPKGHIPNQYKLNTLTHLSKKTQTLFFQM